MSTKYTVVPTPQSNEELKQWIQDWIGFVNEASNETLGVSGTTLRKPKRDHGHPSTWNTELITDMSDLFFRNEWGDTTFNEDISSWDTSNVINMRAVRPVEKDNVSKQTHQHLHFHYTFIILSTIILSTPFILRCSNTALLSINPSGAGTSVKSWT
jgi:surface protein